MITAKFPRPRVLTTAAVVMTSLLSAHSMAAERCAKPREETALKTAALRTELMVASLSCGSQVHYNAFVTKFQGELIAQGRLMRSFFQGQYGRAGDENLNRALTKLANEESQRSVLGRAKFCADASLMFHQLLEKNRLTFTALLDNPALPVREIFSSCGGNPKHYAAGRDLPNEHLQRVE